MAKLYLGMFLLACVAVPMDNTPRKFTMADCRNYCEGVGIYSFVPGYYRKGNKLCSWEGKEFYCTKADTLSFACECARIWSK